MVFIWLFETRCPLFHWNSRSAVSVSAGRATILGVIGSNLLLCHNVIAICARLKTQIQVGHKESFDLLADKYENAHLTVKLCKSRCAVKVKYPTEGNNKQNAFRVEGGAALK